MEEYNMYYSQASDKPKTFNNPQEPDATKKHKRTASERFHLRDNDYGGPEEGARLMSRSNSSKSSFG